MNFRPSSLLGGLFHHVSVYFTKRRFGQSQAITVITCLSLLICMNLQIIIFNELFYLLFMLLDLLFLCRWTFKTKMQVCDGFIWVNSNYSNICLNIIVFEMYHFIRAFFYISVHLSLMVVYTPWLWWGTLFKTSTLESMSHCKVASLLFLVISDLFQSTVWFGIFFKFIAAQ